RVIKYLSEELHRPVTVRYLSKEDESAAVISSEDIDIAFVCAHTYLDLTDSGAAVGICTPIIDGEHTSQMMLLVRADDPAASFKDLADSAAAASDKSSLGGYSYLQYLAGEHGVRVDEYFSELRMGETQETNLRDVIAGDLRVTVANSAQTADWDLSKLKIIEMSPPRGCPPVVVSSDMDPDLRERVRRILLEMNTDTLLPSDSHIDGFVELEHADYAFADTLRRACGSHGH
ncbi:MAG: PhnD/SsuA/transferrin family substrate-binding protein, partial [Coriobacteriia bacterium]|nr:PhnD/SsuA/transferrin family substrate-binding protein [Coriobacteriia bacterium]